MQQKIKEVFTDQFINYNNFTKEIYKQVRNKGKKLEDIAKIEDKIVNKQKITQEQQEKLKLKDEHSQFVSQVLEIMEVYRVEFEKEQQAKQQQEEAQQNKQDDIQQVTSSSQVDTPQLDVNAQLSQNEQQIHRRLDSDVNVAHCTISTPPKQQSKQQPTQEVEQEHKQDVPSQQQKQQPQVTLLMRDQTKIEDAIKTVVGAQFINLNQHYLYQIAQSQLNDPQLAQELYQIFTFMTGISLHPQDLTYDSKIKRATEELTRVATGDDSHKASASSNDQSKYSELRRIIQKVLDNKQLMDQSPLAQFMQMPMMLSQQFQSPLQGFNSQLYQGVPSLGAGLQQTNLSQQTAAHHVPSTHTHLPTITTSGLQQQSQGQQAQQQQQPQTVTDLHSPQKQNPSHLHVQHVSPRKDLSKSPLRQPGAIEKTADIKKNLMLQDWNQDDGEESDEEDNDEIGERNRQNSASLTQQHQDQDEEVGQEPYQEEEGGYEDQHDEDYGDEDDQQEEGLRDTTANDQEGGDGQDIEEGVEDVKEEDVTATPGAGNDEQNQASGGYKQYGTGYRGRGNYRGRGDYRGRGNYRGNGGYRGDYRGGRGGRGGFQRGYSDRYPPRQQQYDNKDATGDKTEGGNEGGDIVPGAEDQNKRFEVSRGGYRGNYRGNYGSRGYYQGRQDQREGAAQGSDNTFFRNQTYDNRRGGRGGRPNYNNDRDEQEDIQDVKEDLASGGFQVVKQRGQKDDTAHHTVGFLESRGPRVARGAQEFIRGSGRGSDRGFRGDYRGGRGDYRGGRGDYHGGRGDYQRGGYRGDFRGSYRGGREIGTINAQVGADIQGSQ